MRLVLATVKALASRNGTDNVSIVDATNSGYQEQVQGVGDRGGLFLIQQSHDRVGE